MDWPTRTAWQTGFVQKRMTNRVSIEAAAWARRKAAAENTSVSRLVGRMLEEQMRRSDSYREAFERFRNCLPWSVSGAATRMSREQTHERG